MTHAGFLWLPTQKAMNKPQLIKKIHDSDFLDKEEKTALIELINHNKRYGLVWENKTEDAEELLRENLPVLREVADKKIFTGDDNPNHIIIEGDNLHALTALSFTHQNKINVIYIDPPYNTGNKDFIYNDTYIDKEDSFKHSKWLSFMAKRLKIAKSLLSNNGAIFISIDDNEQAQLKLLCDEIFLESSFIGNVIWQHSIQGKNDAKTISLHHNYTLIYSGIDFQIGKITRTEEHNRAYSNPDNDKNGDWRSGDVRSPNFRENLRYIVCTPNGNKIQPPANGWRWEKDTLQAKIETGEIIFNKEETKIVRKIYLDRQEGRVPESIWFGAEVGTTREATSFLKEMFEESPFSTPKPLSLIKRIIQISGAKNLRVLDFFAGSGTTLHATMQLNAEDGGNRQCILVTNNENNICEEVTYERNKRVIEGYANAKGEQVSGLTENNLRYFKTEFVGRERSLKNKRKLTELSVDLLRIKEDCYAELKGAKYIRIFHEQGLYLIIVSDDIAIPKAVELIQQLPAESKIKVYVFSEEQDPYTEDFYEVLDKINLCALPDAIYKAYRYVLPKKKSTLEHQETVITNTHA